jgi:HTH-type transcriptional regulator, sugar sensing transcriptional regulator
MVDNMVTYLRELGLSEYEARTYRTLCQASPLTPYETAQQAGLPTSKIYQVLARLEEKGLVLCLHEQSRKRYIPQEIEEFAASCRYQMENTLAGLEEEGRKLKQESQVSYIWNLKGYQEIIDKAGQIIGSARGEILISLWQEELLHLQPALQEKHAAGVRLGLVHFGELSPALTVGTCFSHPIADTLFQEKGGRGLTLVVDSREAMMVTVFDAGRAEGAWSRNRGYVTLAEDYVKHDIYIMKIVGRFDALLIERFGPGYQKLRDVFSDEEEHKGEIG